MYLPKFLEQKFSEFLKIQSKHFGKDAIEKSGGITENANLKNINLAFLIEDGMKEEINYLRNNRRQWE